MVGKRGSRITAQAPSNKRLGGSCALLRCGRRGIQLKGRVTLRPTIVFTLHTAADVFVALICGCPLWMAHISDGTRR